MKNFRLIISIVIILALVSLPGAAMISKADLMGSYPVPEYDGISFDVDDGIWKQPESYNCCANGSGLNYTILDTDDEGSSPEPGPTWGPTWDMPPHAPGSPPPGSPPTPIPSLEELIASYIVKPYSDPINCCDDCTPQTWWKGTVLPSACGRWVVPVERYDPPGPAGDPVPLSPGGHCPESLPVTWYSKVATRLSLF